MEDACGVQMPEGIRALRRLLYCGEWIESHTLHVFMLHAPDFLGYRNVFEIAGDHPEIVEGALRLKKAGNELMCAVGGREIHPINTARRRLLPGARAERACADSRATSRSASSSPTTPCRSRPRCPFPSYEQEYEFVALTSRTATRSRTAG